MLKLPAQRLAVKPIIAANPVINVVVFIFFVVGLKPVENLEQSGEVTRFFALRYCHIKLTRMQICMKVNNPVLENTCRKLRLIPLRLH